MSPSLDALCVKVYTDAQGSLKIYKILEVSLYIDI